MCAPRLVPPTHVCALTFMNSPMAWMVFVVCDASSRVGERMRLCGLRQATPIRSADIATQMCTGRTLTPLSASGRDKLSLMKLLSMHGQSRRALQSCNCHAYALSEHCTINMTTSLCTDHQFPG